MKMFCLYFLRCIIISENKKIFKKFKQVKYTKWLIFRTQPYFAFVLNMIDAVSRKDKFETINNET